MSKTLFAAAVLSLSLAAATARAEGAPEAPSADAAPVKAVETIKANSLNFDLSGLILKGVALNYEHLFEGGHGLLVEGVFRLGSDSDTGKTAPSGNVSLGYRYHFSGKQSSWFAGPLLTFSVGSGEGSVTNTDADGTQSTKSFPIGYTAISGTANVGRRWVIADTVNITARIGAGYTKRFFSTDSTDPDSQNAVEAFEALLSFIPITVDGELSLGLVF
jgi:hypothetical protein